MTVNLPEVLKNNEIPNKEALQTRFMAAFRLIDDIVLKNYISRLDEFAVIPLKKEVCENNIKNIRLFKINEMVYEKNESATYKFASVFNAVASVKSTLFTIIKSDGNETDFYLGIRNRDSESSTDTCFEVLKNAITGQFPGIKIEYNKLKQSKIQKLLETIETDSISAVSCIANNKNKDFITNEAYLQGLEKFAVAMEGKKYTAIIIANPTSQEQLNAVRKGYESIYSQISPYANIVLNYGENSTLTITKGESEQTSETKAEGTNDSTTETETETQNTGVIRSLTEKTPRAKAGSILASTLPFVGAAIGSAVPGVGTFVGGLAGGAIGGIFGEAVRTMTDQTITTTSGGGSLGHSHSKVFGTSSTFSKGYTFSINKSESTTEGKSDNLQLTIQNKSVSDMLERVNQQLNRLTEFESLGMWECAAYFMSDDTSVIEVASATYKALMSGEDTGLETSAVNTWIKPYTALEGKKSDNELIAEYVKNFIHPIFSYEIEGTSIPVMPTSLVSSNELAIHMGLPRKSVCGFPVIEHVDFAKEVISYDEQIIADQINLGSVFNMGRVCNSKVFLDKESLSMHTFVTGSTGSGKSNTIYKLIEKVANYHDVKFMVIEPAKGEYKNVFGNKKDVAVFGSNPKYTNLLKINPFKFPKSIHVLEHVDRLIEIFNVCWPMYAAMPAVLKNAVLMAYETCGWDLITSKNRDDICLFPTFLTLQNCLLKVISKSAYSEEVKSNYIGSLVTRVNSLTNGLNGLIFSTEEINNNILFDENVIIDLSRIGSLETKSLIMGILIMRLGEHRMTTANGMNEKLKHITVIEEAHNILKRVSTEQNPENPSISGKSVELISNAIAEMRTYGEGFVIVDQSPSAVDISAIRNTNTKIIMRLPDEADRRLAGKSAGLSDDQMDEIAKLPKGVGVIYQNNWIEPVLCKIDKFEETIKNYIFETDGQQPKVNQIEMILLESILDNWLNGATVNSIENMKALLKDNKTTFKNNNILDELLCECNQEDIDNINWPKYVCNILNNDNWLSTEVFKMKQPVLTEFVLQNVKKRAPELNNKFTEGAVQCLLWIKSEEEPIYKDVYESWKDYFFSYISLTNN
jgi:hypothetical protein